MARVIEFREEEIHRRLEEEVALGERCGYSDVRVSGVEYALGGMQDNRSQRVRQDLWHQLTTQAAGVVVHEGCTSDGRLESLYPL